MSSFNKKVKEIILENTLYKINDKMFLPFVYNGVYIAASDLNPDKKHLLTRLKTRANKYTLNDVLTIVKRFISEEYLIKPEYKQFRTRTRTPKSFMIESKSYPGLRISISIELNHLYDMFSTDNNSIESAKYICFIYSVFTPDMIAKITDKNVIIETQYDETLYILIN